MTDTEMLKMCKALAGRYNDTNIYDDLVSEGILACYEAKEKYGDKLTKERCLGSARKAMHEYANVGTKAVKVPRTDRSGLVATAIHNDEYPTDLDGIDKTTLSLLVAAMINDTVPVEESGLSVPSHAEEFERVQHNLYLLNKIKKAARKDDWDVVLDMVFNDKGQQVKADEMGVSHQYIDQQHKRVKAIAERVCNK